MNDETKTPLLEEDHALTPEFIEETYDEQPVSLLQREMKIFRSFLARLGMTLMYLTGMLIIGLAIYEAFFVIGTRETTMSAIYQLLIAGAGGFIMAVTTWLWKKVV